ncbi:MAG TPA: hypothetical protein VEL31_12285 [Ktedonobacteraceae bacterium]|nr:hypothetical protein [Ktedonobacteraceae bacterium]
MHGNVQVSVRRGGVGVPEQSGTGLLPDLFRQFRTERPTRRDHSKMGAGTSVILY